MLKSFLSPFRSETGFGTLVAVLFLVVALSIGVILVQQRTNLLPQAKVDPSSSTQIKRDPLLGVRISEINNIDQAVKLGVAKFRVSVESSDAFYKQTEDQKKFLDPILQIFKAAKENNIQLVIVIKPASPVEYADLENRIGLLIENLDGYDNVVFELGNEPNGKNANGDTFWTGDYNSFATFIENSSTIIRQKMPYAKLVIGALELQGKINSTSDEAARVELSSYLDAIGSKVNLNNFAFAIHTYHNTDWFNRIYTLQKSELSKRGINSKIWLTETGVNLQSGDTPESLVQIIQAAEDKNDIEAVIIHSFDSKDGFQLWDLTANQATDSYTKVLQFVQENPMSISATISTKNSNLVNASDKSCSNNTILPPSDNLVWHAFCSEQDYPTGKIECSSNADCPQNTIQTGIDPTTSNQCVQFKEGSRCMQLRLLKSDSGENLYNPADPAFATPNDTYVNNPDNIPFGRVGLGQSPGKEGDNSGPRADFSLFIRSYEQKIARIREDDRVKQLLGEDLRAKQEALALEAEQAAAEAKTANDAWITDKGNSELAKKASDATRRAADAVAAAEAMRKLAKLEQMLKGETTEQCLKADLGIRPWLLARRIKARGEDTREDGTPGEKVNRYLRLHLCSGKDSKLKWRVATEGNDNTQGDGNEDSMERILRLHGDSEDAPYPTPRYPFSEVEGGHVTLTGQGEAEIRQSLEKYINAAKAGKAVVE